MSLLFLAASFVPAMHLIPSPSPAHPRPPSRVRSVACRDGFFDSVSPARYAAKSFGATDTSQNPRDTIPLDQLDAFAARMAVAVAAELDSEWIEQEDHATVAKAAARLYVESRNDPSCSDEVGMILAYIGDGLAEVDMGECFVGPWEVANLCSTAIMKENFPERQGFGYYAEDSFENGLGR